MAKKFFLKHIRIFILISLLIGAFIVCMIAGIAASIAAMLGASEEEGGSGKSSGVELTGNYPLSEEVLALKDDILKELKKYHKEQYIYLFLAVVEQESHGKSEDVFQCSESLGKSPNSISTEASIKQGVKYLSGMLDSAKVTSPTDIDNIKIALQAYNYGGGFITYIFDTSLDAKNYGKWTQENALAYQKKMSSVRGYPVPRSGTQAEALGPYKYGDAYYTEHVLRYYSIDDETSDTGGTSDTGTVKGIALDERMKWLFPIGLPTSPSAMESYLTSITVPTCDTKGNITYISVRCHKKLAASIKVCFEKMAKIKFPVQYDGCYNWRPMSGSSSRSHHSYGVAIDINAGENAQYTHGNKNSPYFINAKVVKIWKSQGFYWGGDWGEAYVDPMHFTYTNH